MRICKDFLKEWGNEWTEGSEKRIVREKEEERNLEREERFTKIAQKKKLLEKKKIQSTLNFKIKNLGESGRIEWEREIRKERLELQEFRENLWSWREGGGGRKKMVQRR